MLAVGTAGGPRAVLASESGAPPSAGFVSKMVGDWSISREPGPLELGDSIVAGDQIRNIPPIEKHEFIAVALFDGVMITRSCESGSCGSDLVVPEARTKPDLMERLRRAIDRILQPEGPGFSPVISRRPRSALGGDYARIVGSVTRYSLTASRPPDQTTIS